jgi:hypothetical protein
MKILLSIPHSLIQARTNCIIFEQIKYLSNFKITLLIAFQFNFKILNKRLSPIINVINGIQEIIVICSM